MDNLSIVCPTAGYPGLLTSLITYRKYAPGAKIIVVDHTRSPFLKEGEIFYLNRLRKYIQVDWVEVKPVKISQAGRTVPEDFS